MQMRLDFPERRSEPFETYTKIPTCPCCGTPIDELDHLVYDGDPHYVRPSDVIGCDHCTSIRLITDYDEMYDILMDLMED